MSESACAEFRNIGCSAVGSKISQSTRQMSVSQSTIIIDCWQHEFY